MPAAHLDALGTFVLARRTILLVGPRAPPGQRLRLPWTGLTVRSAA